MPPRKTSFMEDAKEILTPPSEEKEKTPREKRIEGVESVFGLIQLGCVSFGQLSDAAAIGLHSTGISTEVVNFAEQNEKVAAKIDLLVDAEPIAGIIGAVFPLIAQLLVNHKVFKPEQLANAGVVMPESLESLMKVQMMRQAANAMRIQQQAEEELEELKREMAQSHNGVRPETETVAT